MMISNLDHYHDQNPCFSSIQVTPMKATIIYFPSPFLHSCKNVPASKYTNTTTDTENDRTKSANEGNNSSCCRRENKRNHYSYKERRVIRERQQANIWKPLQSTTALNHLNADEVGFGATIKISSDKEEQCDLNGNRNKYYCYACRNDVDGILKTNSRLADSSNKLRNYSQLVMPIGERRLGSIDVYNDTPRPTSTHQHMNNNNNDNDNDNDNYNKDKDTNNIISQTTTLDCRCFMDNSDMLIVSNIDANRNDVDDNADYDCKNSSKYYNKNNKEISSRTRNKNTNDKLFPIRTLLYVKVLYQLLRKTSTAAHIITTYRVLFTLFIMSIFTTTVNCWTGRQDVLSNCTFPARWEGSWFLSGYQQSIHIKGSQFSYRGKCAASDGNKYLIVDEKGCHRCLVIYEKHKNVLQYKESECEGDSMYMHQSNPSAMAMRSVLKQNDDRKGPAHPNLNGHSRLSSSDQYIMRSNDDMNDCPPDFCKGRETLQNLCDQIPGDALLYSLFRESAEPVKCPLKGPFVFTYNRGHGECKSPVSNIESCTEDSRLLLSFQACPDVQGTESTVEELTCLATWKDGNSRYLVGLVSHHHAISNEERYRCFVYEKITSLMGGPGIISAKDAEYKLAQSGDATCNGLDSAEVGSRIMSLRKPPAAVRCDFPSWFKGPGHWHALMGNAVYNYHKNGDSVHIIKSNGYMETRALCEQINKQTSTEMMAVVHYTTGCQSGFMCMMFYRRDTHIVEIQTGKQASRLEDACAPDHFDINKMPYITLLASDPDPQICPLEGMYNLRGAIGPPYLTTRHKRNHNNKLHVVHGHHHQSSDMNDGNNNAHRRHSTMSFRNVDRIERDIWHASTRGLTVRNHRNKRDAPGCVTNYKAQRQLLIGCTGPDIIDVRPLCSEDGEEEYSCHGSWTENNTVYIIARHKQTKHGVCISYRVTEGNTAKLVIGDACYRGPLKPPEHHLVSNLSVFGKCGDTSSGSTNIQNNGWFSLMAVAILTAFVNRIYFGTSERNSFTVELLNRR